MVGGAALSGPATRVDFSKLPRGWVRGIPQDTRRNSRIVGSFAGHRLAVAPTRNGNFCEAFAGSFAGCRVRASGVVGPTYMGNRQGEIRAVAGDIVGISHGSLHIQFESSPEQLVPVTWVSRPIAAAFFFITAPQGGAQSARLTLRQDGRVTWTSGVQRIHVPRTHS